MSQFEELITTGFARHMPDQTSPNHQSSTHAAAWAEADRRRYNIFNPDNELSDTKPKSPRPDRRSRKSDTPTYPFPDISVVRRFDRSKATSEHNRFHNAFAKRCQGYGLTALRLSELQVTLIGPDAINDAMTERYSYEASQTNPTLRKKAALEVVNALGPIIRGAKTAHHASQKEYPDDNGSELRKLIRDPKWVDQLLERSPRQPSLIDEAARSTLKADGLWQPFNSRVAAGYGATTPDRMGIATPDSLGIIGTEAHTIIQGLTNSKGIGFKPRYFDAPPSIHWMDLTEGGGALIADLKGFKMPSMPRDCRYYLQKSCTKFSFMV